MQARVLVTHGVGFLPQCDQVMSLDEGSITEMGTYDELMANNGDFAEFIRVFTNTEENKEGDPGGLCCTGVHIPLQLFLLTEFMEYAEFDNEDEHDRNTPLNEVMAEGAKTRLLQKQV